MAEKPNRKLDLVILDAVCGPFETELRMRHPDAYRDAKYGDRGLLAVLHEHPDVVVEGMHVWEAYDAEIERRKRLPPLRVRSGDFVDIGGRVFRIGRVNPLARTVFTERLGSDGHRISSVDCSVNYRDGRELEPAEWHPDTNPWPLPPENITDGVGRGRFAIRAHVAHLVASGLTVDDD